jgi:hypothetical protein
VACQKDAGMSSPASPNDLTRHQLDELDALLQRMLSLPLGGPTPDAEPRPAPKPTPATAVTVPPLPLPDLPIGPSHWSVAAEARPAHFVVPALPSIEVVADESEPTAFGPPRLATVHADETPGEILNPPRTLRGVDAPDRPLGYRPQPVPEPEPAEDEIVLTAAPVLGLSIPTDAAPTSAAMFAPPPAGEPVTVPSALRPVYAANAAIEFALDLAGPFGKLFTNRVSKQVLGWSGVAMVLLAAAWVARGAGLIDFPLPPGVGMASR